MTSPLTLLLRFPVLPMPVLSALLLSVLLLSVLAAPVSAQPRRDDVRALLSGFESSATEREWRALGEGAVPVLAAIFDDASELQPVRQRAVWAARFFSTEASRRFLSRVIGDAHQPGMVVRAAVRSLAFAFGRAAVPLLTPRLSHADPAVREAAIEALGALGGGEARAALEARRGIETELADALEAALRALEAAR